MATVNYELLSRQEDAFKALQDKTVREVFYGGAAGGGKSVLGCLWLISSCITYPGTRYLMGRAILQDLKKSTLLTFFEQCSKLGLKVDIHYKYNAQANVIKFFNDSEIHLKDLFQYPSDPEFDSLGSTEFTYAFIDEASQITKKAYNIVKSRLRFKHRDYNIVPKILIASNPTKNFLYTEFYRAWKDNKLSINKRFIISKANDNQHLTSEYIQSLEELDEQSRERLLYGNWEYDSDPSKIFDYDSLVDMFSNIGVIEDGDKFLTCDVARFGRDKTVITVWHGFVVTNIYSYDKSDMEFIKKRIEELRSENNISRSHCVIDEDGVGGGVVDGLSGVRGFVNNRSPFLNNGLSGNYSNLKTQCYFKLSEMVNKGLIYIKDSRYRDNIISDLEQVKRKDADKDGKVRLVDKKDIKDVYGKSPDFGDALMFRMLFVVDSGRSTVLFDDTGLVF